MDPDVSTSQTYPHAITDDTASSVIPDQEAIRAIVKDVLRFLERDNAFIRDFLNEEFEGTKEQVDTTNALTVVVRSFIESSARYFRSFAYKARLFNFVRVHSWPECKRS
jgi:hypothetical protein